MQTTKQITSTKLRIELSKHSYDRNSYKYHARMRSGEQAETYYTLSNKLKIL